MARLIVWALVASLACVHCSTFPEPQTVKGDDEAQLRTLLEDYAIEYRGERLAANEIELPNDLEGPSRDLQQFQPGAKFTAPTRGAGLSFDGFNFGFGGLLPQIIGGFNALPYQILFLNTLSRDWILWFSGALPNRLDPIDYLPETNGLGIDLRSRYGRDVVSLVGQDWADQILASVYTRPSVKVGDKIPAGCVGPTFQLRLDGGRCNIDSKKHEFDCTRPFIRFQILPLTCNLKYKAACSLTGDSWRLVRRFGRVRRDVIGPRAAIYNFGYAVNVTQAFLGFGQGTIRLLQDFGVTRWYNYLSAIVGIELDRMIGSLFGGFLPLFAEPPGLGPLGAGTGGAAVPGAIIGKNRVAVDAQNVSSMVRSAAEWLNENGSPGESGFFRPTAGTVDSSTQEIPFKPTQTARNGYKSDAISTIDVDKLMYNKEQLAKLQGNFQTTPDGQRRLDFEQYALEKMGETGEQTPQPAAPKPKQEPLADNVFVTRSSSSYSDAEAAALLGDSP